MAKLSGFPCLKRQERNDFFPKLVIGYSHQGFLPGDKPNADPLALPFNKGSGRIGLGAVRDEANHFLVLFP